MEAQYCISANDYTLKKAEIKTVLLRHRTRWQTLPEVGEGIMHGHWVAQETHIGGHRFALEGVWYKAQGKAILSVSIQDNCAACELFAADMIGVIQEIRQLPLPLLNAQKEYRTPSIRDILLSEEAYLKSVRQQFEHECRQVGITPSESLWGYVSRKAKESRARLVTT